MAEEGYIEEFCGICKHKLHPKDTKCKYCGNDFSKVGKDITIHPPTVYIGMTPELSKKLNKSEQKFIAKMGKWWEENVGDLQVSNIEIGFPSGIKVILGRN